VARAARVVSALAKPNVHADSNRRFTVPVVKPQPRTPSLELAARAEPVVLENVPVTVLRPRTPHQPELCALVVLALLMLAPVRKLRTAASTPTRLTLQLHDRFIHVLGVGSYGVAWPCTE